MALFPARSSKPSNSASNLGYPTVQFPGEHVYTTTDGDMVDDFGAAHYGYREGVTEAIYARNPWLARYDAILPASLKVILPVMVQPTRSYLWDY